MRALELRPERTVLDLGAGTGKLTRLLVPTGARVLACEPVEAMRATLEQIVPRASILAGTAEAIPLADESVDAVVVAQAFHWFDGARALPEVARVLTPGGRLGLVWNVRDESLDWVAQLTSIIDPHEGNAPRYRSGRWRAAFDESELFEPLALAQFRQVVKGPPQMVVDRVMSISFIAALSAEEQTVVEEQVRGLLASHPQTRGAVEIEFPYRTDVFVTCARER